MIIVVNVGVALSRPPREDAIVRVVVECDSEVEGWETACLMASGLRGVVMPVSSRIVDMLEI